MRCVLYEAVGLDCVSVVGEFIGQVPWVWDHIPRHRGELMCAELFYRYVLYDARLYIGMGCMSHDALL